MQRYSAPKLYSKFIILLKKNERFLKYAFSGVSALAADYGSFLVSYYVFNLSLHLAVPLGLTLGLVVSFIMNKFWVFDGVGDNLHHHPSHVQAVMFIALVVFNALFTYYFVRILLVLGIPASLGKMGAVVMTVVWNYFLYKKVIFKSGRLSGDI